MKKVVFYTILGLGVIVSSLTESCSSTNPLENGKIKKVSGIQVYDDSTYFVSVLFTSRTTKEQRKDLLSQKLAEDYPHFILHEEHLGKRYNEYWYTLKIQDASTF